MTIETSNVKITLSTGEALDRAREILDTLSDQIEQASANDVSCIVTTENHYKLDNEEIESACYALGNLLCLV